jgi:hypothetical protein
MSLYFPNIYPRSQLITFIFILSAHNMFRPHVKHNNIIYIFMKTIIPQHIRYNYSPIMVYVSYYLFICLQSYNGNSFNYMNTIYKKKLHGLSPRANYTDRAEYNIYVS